MGRVPNFLYLPHNVLAFLKRTFLTSSSYSSIVAQIWDRLRTYFSKDFLHGKIFIFNHNSGDVEFKPATLDLPDDEETIAAAEEEEESDVEEELADLKKQNEMDLNELIETLPPGFLL